MEQQRQSSYRFFIQMALNIFLCKKGQEIIANSVIKQNKVGFKGFAYFLILVLTLFFVNQELYFFFKNRNIYQQLGILRSMSITQIKQWQRQHLANFAYGSPQRKLHQDMIGVLKHPARRLSYDSFGYSQVEYAWAFKSPNFILQTIIGSGVFFVISTFLSLMNKQKADLKDAFKVQIFAMIILFIWQVDLIISTQTRLHSYQTDPLDSVYRAFPIFQRREMLKVIIIPCMSLVQIFVRYFLISKAEERLVLFGSIPALQTETNVIQAKMANFKMDQNIEDRINVALDQSKKSHPLPAQIFKLQRQLLKKLLFVDSQQVMARPQITRILRYFVLN